MSDEIRDQYNEIKSFLEKEGFNIFYEVFKSRKNVSDWDTEYDWKKFFEIAKKENAKTIIVSSIDFNKADSWTDEDDEILNGLEKDEIDLIKKHSKKMGSFIFMWFKDARAFRLIKKADWYDEVVSIISETSVENVHPHNEAFKDNIVELNKLSLEELEKEVREYTISNELQSDGGHEIRERFLQSKDIFLQFHGDIPQLDFVVRKLEEEEKARQKKNVPELTEKVMEHIIKSSRSGIRPYVDRELQRFLSTEGVKLNYEVRAIIQAEVSNRMREIEKEEREAMPKLLDKAVEWAKQNKKNRFTKADTEAFLTDTETSLSRENYDLLYSKINTELKK